MRAIILAAGRGNRMIPLTNEKPKCLLKINGKTILKRLIYQLYNFKVDNITVVVGYRKNQVTKEIKNICSKEITIIENSKYYEDINILSLELALKKDLSPFYLFEADCIFEDKCFSLIFNSIYKNKSVWFSKGLFNKNQNGGIIKSNTISEIVDIKIVNRYISDYKNYKKMIGVLKVGENEIEKYSNFLLKACEENINQYYHIPWIDHIAELKSYICDFGDKKVISINTIQDYYKAQEMFKYEVG
ncbi:MAG: NTP transferase domain-containing protein [Bacteroidales bacterium]|nr:NTP transferase domain-containing protein [Bacteroidales bacterium]